MDPYYIKLIVYSVYLIASFLFIFGIKMLSSPSKARKGNLISAGGMFLAIVVTLLNEHILTYEYILLGVVIGGSIGAFLALKVEMTDMPQMVGLLNGFGGGASALIGMNEYLQKLDIPVTSVEGLTAKAIVAISLSLIIGGITFTGSLVAFGKLQGIVTGNVISYPFQHPLNLILLIGVFGLLVVGVMFPSEQTIFLVIIGISLLLGILLVIPIGGADMPVAISLLNSYSGIAASATGFVIDNNMLIIAGALVGASGLILTNIMCKAMNRSLLNVVMGGWGQNAAAEASGGAKREIVVKSIDSEEAAMIFDAASSVMIIPGYGMAVAQAQHATKELMDILNKKGIDVKFAIHPVAGRMPGHMNILLAESNVPYEKLYSLEDINEQFVNTDISLIIGANDVVNPAARNNPASPIYGMPILNADYSKTVIIIKRSMAAGYAGIDNELFYNQNTLMYFGDAKDAISKLNNELKNI